MKRLLILAIAMLTILVAYYDHQTEQMDRSDPVAIANSPTPEMIPAPKPKRKVSRRLQLMRQPRTYQMAKPNEDDFCARFFYRLVRLDLNNIDEPVDEKLFADARRCPTFPNELDDLGDFLNENCLKKNFSSDPAAAQMQDQQCRATLIMFRMIYSSKLNSKVEIGEITDPSLLIDIIMGSFVSDEENVRGDRKIEASRRLMGIEPDLYFAVQAYYIGLITKIIDSDLPFDPDHQIWLDLKEAKARKQELHPKQFDEHIESDLVEIALKYPEDIDMLQRRAEEYQQSHPQSSVPLNFLAVASYRRGDYTKAIAFLQRGDKLAPNKKWQENIKAVNDRSFNLGITASLNLSLDDEGEYIDN